MPGIRLSAIVPATDKPQTLERCVDAILTAADPPEELIQSRRSADGSATQARNAGAQRASGDVLVFVDADVEVHPDAFQSIRRAFAENPRLTAVFGSYDDDPPAGGVVSRFRNLLHHHVHHRSAGRASTFWSGLGAIRRDAFLLAGGFSEERFSLPSVEDIELGMRLSEAGAWIELDPRIQGKHLKCWTLLNLLRVDLMHRGVPWTRLMLRKRRITNTLNLAWNHRASAAMTLLVLVLAVFWSPWALLALPAALVALNPSFYRLLLRRARPLDVLAAVPLHALHLLVATASLPIAFVVHSVNRLQRTRGGPDRFGPHPTQAELARQLGEASYFGPERRGGADLARGAATAVLEGPPRQGRVG